MSTPVNRVETKAGEKMETSSPNVITASLFSFNHFKAENNWKMFIYIWMLYQKVIGIICYKINCLGASSKLLAFSENYLFYVVLLNSHAASPLPYLYHTPALETNVYFDFNEKWRLDFDYLDSIINQNISIFLTDWRPSMKDLEECTALAPEEDLLYCVNQHLDIRKNT